MTTSGWFAQRESDVQSEHVYFNSRVLEGTKPGRFLFLSECGGFSRRIEGHVTRERKNCGCIYTQLSDVEGETNGLYTYDRQVRKVRPEAMREIAADVRRALEQVAGNG